MANTRRSSLCSRPLIVDLMASSTSVNPIKFSLWDNSHVSASLLNVATGTTTPISQRFPPVLLQQLTGSPTAVTSLFQGKGIDDRGDVLDTVGRRPGFRQTETFILTRRALPCQPRLQNPLPSRFSG